MGRTGFRRQTLADPQEREHEVWHFEALSCQVTSAFNTS